MDSLRHGGNFCNPNFRLKRLLSETTASFASLNATNYIHLSPKKRIQEESARKMRMR